MLTDFEVLGRYGRLGSLFVSAGLRRLATLSNNDTLLSIKDQ